jgi:hypothetical protein
MSSTRPTPDQPSLQPVNRAAVHDHHRHSDDALRLARDEAIVADGGPANERTLTADRR